MARCEVLAAAVGPVVPCRGSQVRIGGGHTISALTGAGRSNAGQLPAGNFGQSLFDQLENDLRLEAFAHARFMTAQWYDVTGRSNHRPWIPGMRCHVF